MIRYFKLIIWFATLPLMVGCGETASNSATEHFKTLSVERQDYTLDRRFTVKIESTQRIGVRPPVGGTLMKVCVREGAQVKKGQQLFVIDQAPYIAAANAASAQVAAARATLSTAQLNLEGKEQLYAQQMVGEFDLRRARHAREEAEAQLKTAEAELATARTNLSYTTINSPIDGTIATIQFREGNVVSPTMEHPLVTISANNHLYAYTSLSEQLFADLLDEYGCSSSNELLTVLPEVRLLTTWGEELPQKGHIDAIGGNVDFTTGAILIRASFDNSSELFRNGSNGYVVLPTTKHDVFVIPQDATIRIQDKYFVFRVIGGKAVSTEVKVLPADNEQNYVVTGGLKDGDVIIAGNAGMVSEGMEVNDNESPNHPQ